MFRLCTVMLILSATVALGQEDAIQEGLPDHLIYMESNGPSGDVDGLEQHIAKTRWPPGQTLRVCFFGGDEVVHELVAQVASEWSEYANLKFDFGPKETRRDCMSPSTGFSQIRVSFGGEGYWSLVGTDSVKKANQYQPSLNLEGFDTEFSGFNGFTTANVVANSAPDMKATILHEFGHAIGLLHEHQNRNLNCWNEIIKDGPNGAYAYFRKPPNGWSKDKVDRNLGIATAVDPGSTSGAPDPASIMMYRLPATILRGGASNKCFIDRKNIAVSRLDQQWVASFYPHGASEPINEASQSPYSTAAIPVDAADALSQDYVERIKLDLLAGDASVRREARSRLSDFLKTPDAASVTADLVKDLEAQPYRYQLGVAVAVSGAKDVIPFREELTPDLTKAFDATSDATLKSNLGKALGLSPQ